MFFTLKEKHRSYFEEVRDLGWVVLLKLGIKIRKKGNSFSPHTGDYITLCPFHTEKSPSMHFYNNSSRFFCYGCGASGDVFNFISRILGHNYYGDKIKTYRWLKKNYGIPLPWEKL
ncbi:hypothetical protein KAI52_03510 [Candidatus Parcubacteria bacterium]|nr:hypothetical protein [Candidatus Parcubacteria bacterium]